MPQLRPVSLGAGSLAVSGLLLGLLCLSTPRLAPAAVTELDEAAAPDGAAAPADSADVTGFTTRITQLVAGQIRASPGRQDTSAGAVVEVGAPFVPFEGRVVRRIEFEQFDPFGYRFDDPAHKPWYARAGNAIYVRTRSSVIASYMLVRPGDILDPVVLASNERLLRGTRFIRDARIAVVPVPGASDSVDLVVSVQDVLSVGAKGTVRKADSFRLGLFDRNLLGRGLDAEYAIDYEKGRHQEVEHRLQFIAPNIRGSFIEGRFKLTDSSLEEIGELTFGRSNLAPQIHWTGGLGFYSRINRTGLGEAPVTINDSSHTQDLWLGRVFSRGEPPPGGAAPNRLQLSGRVTRIDFDRRPPVDPDRNRAVHDRVRWLGSVSIYRDDARTGRFIFGYGRTEDLPCGHVASLTGGYEHKEFEPRLYVGAEARAGTYRDDLGYHIAIAVLGTHVRDGRAEDGALDLAGGYIGNLIELGRFRLRTFATASYTQGIGQESGAVIRLQDALIIPGLHDLHDSELRGRHRFSTSIEPVLFTPWLPFGFRAAAFAFSSISALTGSAEALSSAKYYPVFGLGVRFHNEGLVFDPFEVRLSYTSSPLPGADELSISFQTAPTLGIARFLPGPPSVVSYD